MRVIVTAAAIVCDEAHLATLETFGKEHGRLEERRYWQIGKMEWFADRQERHYTTISLLTELRVDLITRSATMLCLRR